MSLLTMLTQISPDRVPPLTGQWRQFVLDHLAYLAKQSRSYNILPEVMNLYRYDLARFVKERLQRRQDMVSIILVLNNMDNDFSFDKPGVYLVPEDLVVENLYRSYQTTTTNKF